MTGARSAIILGGTGQIGRAVSRRLVEDGWAVTLVARSAPRPEAGQAPGVGRLAADRRDPAALRRVLGGGADAVIDITAYDADDARALLDFQDDIGALVVISSSGVYRDAQGRTLDEAAIHGFPDFPAPISEDQPTVAPGPQTYSTRKVALEQALLQTARVPVTILRPCAIHGPGSVHAREWWFVKRMRDARPAIPLAYDGASRFHTTSVRNIAALTAVVVALGGARVLNIADDEALTVGEIGALIARHMAYEGALIGLGEAGFPGRLGRTPWSTPRPFVLDTRAARAVGYAPVADYAATIGEVCDDLLARAAGRDWKTVFPVLAAYPYDLFDYAAEDAAIREGRLGDVARALDVI